MSRYFNINGTWHQGGHAWININGAWSAIGNMWVNINGVWHALFSYYWSVGGWGGCSASCGGGVQYRDVVCMRNDGWNGGWEGYCNAYVGAKPATSQACNTHSCVSCRYSGPTQNYAGTNCTVCYFKEMYHTGDVSRYECRGGNSICAGSYEGALRSYADTGMGGAEYWVYYMYEVCKAG